MKNKQLEKYFEMISKTTPESAVVECLALFKEIYEDGYRQGIENGVDIWTETKNN